MSDTATYLREAREKRGLTLDDVSEATRIPRHYLHMMEGEGDNRLISDRLYLVHYVRQYAAYLQIEEVEWLAAQFIRESNRLPTRKHRTTQERRMSRHLVPWLLLLLLLVGIGGAYVFESDLLTGIWPKHTEKTPAAALKPTTAERGTRALVTPIQNTQTAKIVAKNTVSEAVSVLQPEASEIIPPKPEAVETTSTGGEQDASATEGNAIDANAPQPPESEVAVPVETFKDEQRLEIVAREKAWVRVIVDGQGPQDMMMKPGDSGAWSAKKQFVLTFGNAGGVDLTLNGKKLSPLGTSGQVIRNYQLPR